MILQSLNDYYERKATDPDADIAPYGFEWKDIGYVIALDADGLPLTLSSTFEGTGRDRRPKRFLVPQSVKRASNVAANLLWDNPEYVLGIDRKGKPERVAEQHRAFVDRLNDLGSMEDQGLRAIRRFMQLPDKAQRVQKLNNEIWDEMCTPGANVSFSMVGESGLILERPAIRAAIATTAHQSSDSLSANCLVTGEFGPIERLHPAIRGVRGARSTGANIVSFNLGAFASYGKDQGVNAPVCKKAAFQYTAALNHLLRKDSRQKLVLADTTTVFWSERRTDFESQFIDIFGEPEKDDPDRGTRAVESLYKSVQMGTFTGDDTSTRFYVLGLAPNASRIAVRFWIVDTVAGMATKILQHFEDLKIVHGPRERDSLSLFRLLISTAVQGKAENIPPNVGGETMRAILEGLPYPPRLLQALVRRIRAEHDITHARASLIKGCINRSTRSVHPHLKEELKVSLDTNNSNVGYRLGRLFATLEKVQTEASPGINATIRERFYGAASVTPVAVFSNLMRLKNHHLAKLESKGRRIYFEKLIAEIMDSVSDFPAHLSLPDQGRFAIGYYHQSQHFYVKSKTSPAETIGAQNGGSTDE